MAYLRLNGCELGSSSTLEVITVSGSMAASQNQVRSGDYAWRANPSNSTGWFTEDIFTNNTTGVTRHQFWIYVATLPGAACTIFRLTLSNGSIAFNITMQATGVLQLRNGSSHLATQVGVDSAPLTTGEWHAIYLEYDCTTPGGSGAVIAQIDGQAWTSASGLSVEVGGIARREIGPGSANVTCDMYFDDIVAADGSETLDHLTRIIHVQPAGDADTSLRGTQGTDWDTGTGATPGSGGTGGTAWQQIDEVTPNDDTDWVELINSSANQSTAPILDFSVVDPATRGIGAGDTIKCVAVNLRHRPETASNCQNILRIKGSPGGTVSESASVTSSNTAWLTNHESAGRNRQRLLATSNPDGGAWSPASVAAMIMGFRSPDASPDLHVTALWGQIAFVQAVAGGGGGDMKVKSRWDRDDRQRPHPFIP